jgi:AraC-like DNA-binding protein
MQQRGQEMRLVFGAQDELHPGHAGLIRLLARAHTIRHRLFEERLTIGEVAQAENLIPSYVTRLVRLTFLAPDITASILSGPHDPDLTASRLMADTRLTASIPLRVRVTGRLSSRPKSRVEDSNPSASASDAFLAAL